MDNEYAELPPDAEVGEMRSWKMTRHFLHLQDLSDDTRWFVTGRHAEEGHLSEEAAQAEWDGLDQSKYSGYRIVQVDTLLTLTVMAKGGG